MNSKLTCGTMIVLALVVSQAKSIQPETPRVFPAVRDFDGNQDAGKDKENQPDKDKKIPEKKLTEAPKIDFGPTLARSEETRRISPNFIGDHFSGNRLFCLIRTPAGTGKPMIVPQILANPSSGGPLGRFKASEDANPFPQDRLIFTYDYFGNSSLGGLDVNRYQFGFEKTFLDGRTSIEVRAPFGSTLNSDVTLGSQNRNVEFGDLRVMLKGLLYQRETFSVAAGLSITLPTARDTVMKTPDGTDSIRIYNRAVVLEPFLGTSYTPNDRLFVNSFLAVSFDPTGNPVDANFDLELGLRPFGTVRDQTWLFADLQVGYWLVRPGEGRIVNGFAPCLELHYGGAYSGSSFLSGGGYLMAGAPRRIHELNLTAGLNTMVGENMLVSLGAVVPLRGGDNRSFEYQIALRAAYFFGRGQGGRRSAILGN